MKHTHPPKNPSHPGKPATFLLGLAPLLQGKNPFMKQAVILFLFLFSLSSSLRAQTDTLVRPPSFLPLQAKNLEAKPVDKSIVLRWQVTANEEARNFEVERSEDGTSFRTIGGRLAGGGQGPVMYEFVDALPKRNVSFTYRIRVHGKDGSGSFSEVQDARVEDDDVLQWQLRQNPVRNNIELALTTAVPVQLLATVLTRQGQRVVAETVKLASGTTHVSLSAQKLQTGFHHLVLEAGKERKIISFIKE